MSIRELDWYQQAGGQSLIDMTTVGIRPDPQSLRVIAERTGLNVIAGCGLLSPAITACVSA